MIVDQQIQRMLLTTFSFAVPYVMLASRLEARDGQGWRRVVAICGTAAFALAMTAMGCFTNERPSPDRLYTNIMFAGIILLSTLLILLCRRCTTWTALFCGVFGYSMQNLGSNLLGLAVFAYERLIGPYDEFGLSIMLVITAIAAYTLCHLLFVRRMPHRGLLDMERHPLIVLVLAVVFINIVADSVIKNLPATGFGGTPYLTLAVAHTITCLLTLYFEFEALVNTQLVFRAITSARALEERERQYHSSRESVEAINARMHDIRHAVARVLAEDTKGEALPREAIAAAIHEIQTLDSSVSTGNAALDTALTEKRLLCAHEGITLTCMVDGLTLSAMDTSDLYALACGLIDEAMEAVRSCREGSRSISISVKRAGGMAHIHVEHDGASGQPGEVDAIVAHYDGVVARGADGDIAFVNALIPIP